MLMLRIAVAAILLFGLRAEAGPNRWTPSALYGGEAWAIAVAPDDADLLFTGTITSGLFRSIDGGITWERLANYPADRAQGILMQASVQRGAGRGTSPARILVGGDSFARIYRSTDNGDSWTPSTTTLPFGVINEIAENPANRDILYAAHGFSGIYKSVDGGDTWIAMNTGLGSTFCTSVVVDPLATNTLLATCSGLHRSIDAGTNWTSVTATGLPASSLNLVRNSPIDSDTFFVTNTNGVYRTTDGGMTWTNTAAGGLLPDFDFRALEFDPTNANTVYVGASAGPWRSIDLGDTWVAANNGHVGNLDTGLAIHPDDTARIVAATLSGIWRSTDSGANWQRSETGFRAVLAQDMAFTPGNANRYFVSAASGLYRTLDGGASFEYLTGTVDGLSIGSLYMDSADSQHVVASGNSRLYETTDGGDTWADITMSAGFPFGFAYSMSGAPATPSLVYAASDGNPAFNVSTDGGSTWTSPGITPNDYTDLAVDPMDSMAVYGGWSGSVHFTDNGGSSWNNRSTGLPNAFVLSLAISPSNSLELLAVTSNAGVYRTTDGGMGWTAINNGLPVLNTNDGLIDFTTPNRFYVGSLSGIHVSEDSGANWTDSGTALINSEVDLVRQNIANGDEYYAAAYADTLFTYTRVPPGLTVTPQTLNVAEGSGDTFNITLDADASDPVIIALSTDNAECSVFPDELVLMVQEDPGEVTVTGEPDQLIDGSMNCTVITGPADSIDPAYDQLNPPDVAVTVTDSDIVGVQVLASQPLMVMEPDGATQFTIRLLTTPQSSVSMDLMSTDTTEGSVSPGTLTIMPADAINGALVTVTSVDDSVIDGDVPFTIEIGLTSSTDGNYVGIDPADVSAINLDDDHIIFNDSLEAM